MEKLSLGIIYLFITGLGYFYLVMFCHENVSIYMRSLHACTVHILAKNVFDVAVSSQIGFPRQLNTWMTSHKQHGDTMFIFC